MEDYKIEPKTDTYFTPGIHFSVSTGVWEMWGRSYHKDPSQFYDPIFSWIDEFIKKNLGTVTLNVRLTYFNTEVARRLLLIFDKLDKHNSDSGSCKINWYYQSWDEDMKEDAEDFAADLNIEFNIIAVE